MGRKRVSDPINDIYKLFGIKIKELRTSRNMTQIELAEMLSVSNGAIAQYEVGTRKVPLQIILKISELFDISVDDLIGTSDFGKTSQVIEEAYDSSKYSERHFQWIREVEEVNFSDEEFEEIINFAKYVVSKRKGRLYE